MNICPDREHRRQGQVPERRDDEQRDRLERAASRWSARPPCSSKYAMTTTSEVVLSIEIVSLPVGGTITRIACGSTIRRRVCVRDSPSAPAASLCPWSTDWMPRAHDLRHVGGLVEPQAEQRRGEHRDHGVGVHRDERRPERDAEAQPRVQRREEVPEDQLRDQRGAAEQPDVDGRRAREHRVGRQPHHREQHPADDPDRHRQHGEDQRVAQPAQHRVGEEVLADDVPLEVRVRAGTSAPASRPARR